MKLSKNLSLNEVTKSNTAIRNGIYNNPTAEHLKNLKTIAIEVFQPIREHFGVPIGVSSGYRSKELNNKIGGSRISEHCQGMAFDLDADIFGGVTNKEMFEFIRDNLDFRQLINEFDYSWVHVSFNKDDNKKQVLECYKKDGRTRYKII
tara:strand:+ start:1173 stop:1619 length:447 start_codon:yes stop_codon:yes gene_type:complete